MGKKKTHLQALLPPPSLTSSAPPPPPSSSSLPCRLAALELTALVALDPARELDTDDCFERAFLLTVLLLSSAARSKPLSRIFFLILCLCVLWCSWLRV